MNGQVLPNLEWDLMGRTRLEVPPPSCTCIQRPIEVCPEEHRPYSSLWSSQELIPEEYEQICALLYSDPTKHVWEQPPALVENAQEPLSERMALASGNKKLFANVMCESCWQTKMGFQCVCVSVAWTILYRADKAGVSTSFFCVNVILP